MVYNNENIETRGLYLRVGAVMALDALVYGAFILFQTRLINNITDGQFDFMVFGFTLLFFAAYIGLEFLENYVRESEYAKYCVRVKTAAGRAYLMQPADAHIKKSYDENISFFQNIMSAVLNQNVYLTLYCMKQLCTFIVSFVVLIAVSWLCSIPIVIAAVVFGMVIKFFKNRLQASQTALQDTKTMLVKEITQVYDGFDEIHINGMTGAADARLKRECAATENALMDYRNNMLKAEVMGVGQNMIIYIIILIVGGILAGAGYVGVGVFVSGAELSVGALNGLSMFMQLQGAVKGSAALRKQLVEYIDSSCTAVDTQQAYSGGGDILLEAQGLKLGYDERKILDDVDISICRGRKYLLMGESGCGKTTLLNVLMKHRSADAGTVAWHTGKIAYVTQEPFLFEGTLRENLVFDGSMSDGRLRELLVRAGLDFQPDMMVEDNGANMSGGQRARVSLVRALIEEPELIIADEPTANLDAALGEEIEKLILTLYEKSAVLMVTHRSYCADMYDNSIRLSEGKLKDEGVR